MRATKEDFWDWVNGFESQIIFDWLDETKIESAPTAESKEAAQTALYRLVVRDKEIDKIKARRDFIVSHGRKLIEWHCTPSKIEALFQAYLESKCYRCEGCREWFTSIDDLNEDNLCEACAYEETVREKAETEFRKEVMDEKES